MNHGMESKPKPTAVNEHVVCAAPIRLGYLTLAIALVGLLTWINGRPEAAGLIPDPWDKLAHAVTFTTIAFVTIMGLGSGRRWLAFSIVLLLAGFDEVRQMSLPGRTASVGDFAADVTAALAAILFVAGSRTPNGSRRVNALVWRLNRLRVMSPAEVAYRVVRALRVIFERLGFGLAHPLDANGKSGAAWIPALPTQIDATAYERAADKILAGHFEVFQLHDAMLGFPPKWNTEPKNGIDAPLVFGKTLRYRDERVVGDIKYLWEPNRHLELVTLAQAWHLTRNDKYATGCRVLLTSWFEQCPYPLGPNWTSSLEHGVRLVNWSIAWHLLGGDSSPLFTGADGPEFRHRWLNSIYCHCHFVAGHLSRHSSANNHLMGELMGLFVGAVTWPGWPESERWRRMALLEFEGEALKQTAPDGVNREQAVWYHHEVADMMLLVALFGRANGVELSPQFWQRLEAMLEFIRSIMDGAGNVPMIGDADDAVMVRFSQEPDFHPFRSLLTTGALLFKRADFKAAATAQLHDKTRWLLGDRAAEEYEALGARHAPPTRAFPQGGYYVLGQEFGQSDEIRIVADAAPLGYLSIAAHGHADALSLTLAAGGRELLVDPGTYAYHTQTRWRDYFRGTSAHNTIRVDKLDQSVSGGHFMWLRKANSRCIVWESGDEADRFIAEHDGYQRLGDPVRHRREVMLNKVARELVVVDTVECLREHYIEQFWHFSESCNVQRTDQLQLEIADQGLTARMRIDPKLDAVVVTGDEERPLGWISRRYDERHPTTTLVCSGRIAGETTFTTQILLS